MARINPLLKSLGLARPVARLIQEKILAPAGLSFLQDFLVQHGIRKISVLPLSLDHWRIVARTCGKLDLEHHPYYLQHTLPALLETFRDRVATVDELHAGHVFLLKILRRAPNRFHEVMLSQTIPEWLSGGQGLSSIPQNWSRFKHLVERDFIQHGRAVELVQELGDGLTQFDRNTIASSIGDLPPNEQRFQRLNFEKTGSELVPLGGRLSGHLFREVTPASFDAWKTAHDDEQLQGHVEPILKAKNGRLRIRRFEKDGKPFVRVFSRKVGERIDYFALSNPEFVREVFRQKRMILKRLEELDIVHGHAHRGNFVVRMQDQKPVVSIIDFDRAVKK